MRRCLKCKVNLLEFQFPSVLSMVCNKCIDDNVVEAHAIGGTTPPGKGPGGSIARQLLDVAGYKASTLEHVGPMAPPINCRSEHVDLKQPDDRPLIDRLHEATFTDELVYIEDKYTLRMILRKAHCFTLDNETSALVADFSIAIAADLESARRMAIPPFPVTWIDLSNRDRIKRIRERGVRMTSSPVADDSDCVERVGWLIYPGDHGGYFATYVTGIEGRVFTSPLAFWWHAGEPYPESPVVDTHSLSRMVLGVEHSNVNPYDAFPTVTPIYADLIKQKKSSELVLEMMKEIAGELRHIWGFLIALGAGQLGVQATTSEARKHDAPPKMMRNGKPLLPLEHKVLHLHLGKRMTVDKVIARAVTHHKNREHEVRSHFRCLRDKVTGEVRKRVPVRSHVRGDERLGRIDKSYRVER